MTLDREDLGEDIAGLEEEPELAEEATLVDEEVVASSDGESAPESALTDEGAPVEARAEIPAEIPVDIRVEAILFSTEEPAAVPRIAELARCKKGEVLEAIDRLNLFYAESSRAFRIAAIAGGFQLVTTPELARYLTRMHDEKTPAKLSRAALETLAIIAFKQPVTRAEVDAIRGVSASDRVLRHLLERKAIRIAGRAEAPGRPLLYGTTKEFLEYFGLSSLGDLPRTDELVALLAGDRPTTPSAFEELEAEETAPTGDIAPQEGESRSTRPAWMDDEDDEEGEVMAAEEEDVEDSEAFEPALVNSPADSDSTTDDVS